MLTWGILFPAPANPNTGYRGSARLVPGTSLEAAICSPFLLWRAPYATVHADNTATQTNGVTFELARAVPVEVS
jgi:hypothetical protein